MCCFCATLNSLSLSVFFFENAKKKAGEKRGGKYEHTKRNKKLRMCTA